MPRAVEHQLLALLRFLQFPRLHGTRPQPAEALTESDAVLLLARHPGEHQAFGFAVLCHGDPPACLQHLFHLRQQRDNPAAARLNLPWRHDEAVARQFHLIPLQLAQLARPHGGVPHDDQHLAEIVAAPAAGTCQFVMARLGQVLAAAAGCLSNTANSLGLR